MPIVGELELASRWLRGRIVAITGTKGKSTTTTLTGRMLEEGGFRVLVGGNIGHALSAQVDDSTDDTIHVIEASSFQLETADTFAPWIAVLLNFSPDHLDRHATVEEYAAAKTRIFEHQDADGWAVLNADDPAAVAMAGSARSQRLLFSLRGNVADGVVVSGNAIVRRAAGVEQPLVPLASIRLLGPHLVADVLAAAAVAWLAGVKPDAMTRAVEGFTGLEHALEPVVECGGVRFVNDSKATNVEAARRAIESFGPGLVVIMGGRFKGGDFGELAAPLHERQAKRGRDRRGPAAAARGTGRERHGARCGGHGRRGADRVRRGLAGQRGGAGAGVRQLRHVRGLRGTGPRVQTGSDAACGGMERRARAVSSHQPAGAVKNRPLGTQAAPVCEGGVLASRPADDC